MQLLGTATRLCIRGWPIRGSVLHGRSARRHFAEQVFLPVSATLAISHFPSMRTMLNRSVPQ
jgi:hypothetical protein